MLKIYLLPKSLESENILCNFFMMNEYLLPDPISVHVDIPCYAKKLIEFGENFIATFDGEIAGVICGYANDSCTKRAHIQFLSEHQSKYTITKPSTIL